VISADAFLASVQIPLGAQARPGIRRSCHSEAERGGGISLSTTLAAQIEPGRILLSTSLNFFFAADFLIRPLATLR
jgi:hypothetical protein